MVDFEIILKGIVGKYIVGTLTVWQNSCYSETKQAASNKYQVAKSVTLLNYIYIHTSKRA